MKKFLIIAFALCTLGLFASCNKPEEGSDSYTLSVDKAEVNVGDAVTFTITSPDGKDVTSLSTICMVDGMCLAGKVYTTTEAGTFDFEAHYLGENGDQYIATNIVTITVK